MKQIHSEGSTGERKEKNAGGGTSSERAQKEFERGSARPT